MRNEILRMENVHTQSSIYSNLNGFNISVIEKSIVGISLVDEIGIKAFCDVVQGNIPISDGQVYLNEKLVNYPFKESKESNHIYDVNFQNKLLDGFSVLDNVFVSKRVGIISRKALKKQFLWTVSELDLHVNPDENCYGLSQYQRCVVEILRSIFCGMGITILSSLSDFLSDDEVLRIQRLLKKLQERGYTFLYISDNFGEVRKFCDITLLMKDGMDVKQIWGNDYHLEMSMNKEYAPLPAPSKVHEKRILNFQNVSSDFINEFDFSLYKGECLGIRIDKEAAKNICNIIIKREKKYRGHVFVKGNDIKKFQTKRQMLLTAMGIDEDALNTMLMYELSGMENLCIGIGRKTERFLISKNIEKNIYKEYKPLLGDAIDAKNLYELSTNDLYNLIYYRILLINPAVVIIVHPLIESNRDTKNHILNLIRMLKAHGMSIVLTMSGIESYLEVVDRVIITHKRKVVREYLQREFENIQVEQLIL